MNMHFKSLFIILCLPGLAPAFGYTQPDMPISAGLKSNSESWKVKVKQNGIWGKKPAIVNFGPLKTLSTETEKNHQNTREVDRELYRKNIHTVKSSESSMELELYGTDTAIDPDADSEGRNHQGKKCGRYHGQREWTDEESYRVSCWLDEMYLGFQNDSTFWHYIKLDSGQVYGILENRQMLQVTLYQASNLEGKKMKDIMFTQPALGIVFEYQGKQVAAVQTLMKQSIWISKDLDQNLRNAILATSAALMATIKSGNANGF